MFSKRLTGLGCAAALVLLSRGCLTPPSPVQAQADFSLSLASEGIASLEIDWRAGTITVRVDASAKEITARGTKFVTATSQGAADEALAALALELTRAVADAPQATLRFTAPVALATFSADVEVVLPAGLALGITSQTGAVSVQGNHGATSVALEDGTIKVQNHIGDVKVRAGNCAVTVDSQGGNVDALGATSHILVVAAPSPGGSVRARADVGAVRIRVPADFGASLHLLTPPLVARVDADLTGFLVTDLAQQPFEVSATLNGGGGEISGECETGNVYFRASSTSSTP